MILHSAPAICPARNPVQHLDPMESRAEVFCKFPVLCGGVSRKIPQAIKPSTSWYSIETIAAGRTVLEVLRDFSSARPPLEWLVQCCPRLRPRQFSIASSGAAHPRQAHVLLAVVDYRTPFKRRKRGLCSSWLAGLQPGEQRAI